ncbi:MAG: hypothetical protein CL537_05130 [Alcanivoracaceae bacterium]|uniref:hypothetical protein n=1 Tax=Alcanivorax sp. MD8A TaxID=1177157 RepID=UPI000C526B57|nr:hypothetical protein [Alcanivorax sp. MD8A]MAX54884.1 hypothetical protein [Alcanivoracaceae bacterium]MCG8439345.1 hypothetical protein [Pseudomonadales bacterium]PNE03657.1 hypothetical protein A15D_00877 [Alcanivorax sp. MD8A]
MNTIFRSAGQVSEKALSPLKAQPLLYRALQLVFALAAYAAGVYLVDLATPDARIPVILFAVYFLPAVLRAWLQFYWQLRGDSRADSVERHTA